MPRKSGSAGRFVKPTIVWAEIEKLVNPEEKSKFMAFKGKSESYWRRVQSNPATPPAIDWTHYSKLIPDKSFVDKLKTEYEKYTVPMPKDTLSVEVDKQWNELCPKIKKYCEEQEKIINTAQQELKKINALPPIDTITMEMYHDLYPNEALKPVSNPTFWPHTPEEQLGYVDPADKKK